MVDGDVGGGEDHLVNEIVEIVRQRQRLTVCFDDLKQIVLVTDEHVMHIHKTTDAIITMMSAADEHLVELIRGECFLQIGLK